MELRGPPKSWVLARNSVKTSDDDSMENDLDEETAVNDQTLQETFATLWGTLDIGGEDATVEASATLVPDIGRSLGGPLVGTDSLPPLDQPGSHSLQADLVIGATIGQGGMGIVKLATQSALGREVAIKTLKQGTSPRAVTGLLREAWLMGALEHPNIVPVHQLGRQTDGSPLLVMKRISGVVWSKRLESFEPSRPKRSSEDFAKNLRIFLQVCNAVEFAHSRGIIHRDIKPENVMIGPFGEVYLLDWGVAVSTNESDRGRLPLASEISKPAGTPAYMAPEMVDPDTGDITSQTDVFLLGATLHELLTNAPPNHGNTIYEVMFEAFRCAPKVYAPELPQELVRIALRAMARNRADRYETVAALRQAVDNFLEHRSSADMVAEVHERLVELRVLVAAEEVARAPIQRISAECRFACQRALKSWPDNVAAQSALRELTLLMVDFELKLGDFHAASHLLEEVEDPPAALLKRVSTFLCSLELDAARFEKLEQMEHEADLDVSARARGFLFLGLTVFFTVIPLTVGVLSNLGVFQPGTSWGVLTSVFFAFSVCVGALVGRRYFKKNRANRRIIRALFVTAGGFLADRLASAQLNHDMQAVNVHSLILFALAGGLAAVLLDRRLVFAGFFYILGLPFMLMLPTQFYIVLGVTNFLALGSVTLTWMRPDLRHFMGLQEEDPN
ncbi:MAG: hypothetical protein CO108_02995 [Deltaproteobacteria bacterium CG_4_9_14_3_um_filter_63_12]|nr:MAG: hypothetical protein CO108_02995 [Deltaproteobacteria bacterium CG_4_9_14_3_um_filter_63_12]